MEPFPPSAPDDRNNDAGAPSSRPPSAGPATILLVDDEEAVRKLIGRILRMNGYLVLEARDGEEALSLSESRPDPIHLLITDIMMPVMNGKELAERLSELRPGMRILFISGYPGDILLRQLKGRSTQEYLPKPFPNDKLLEIVASLLKRPGRA